jgi:hypothetical protein
MIAGIDKENGHALLVLSRCKRSARTRHVRDKTF